MSKPAKLLVILIFLLAVGFLFVSLKASARIGRQADMIASLKDSVAGQSEVIGSLKEVVGPAKDKIANLSAENNQLSGDLKIVQEAKAQIESELPAIKAEKEKAENELQSANSRLKPLEEQNRLYKQQVDELRQVKEAVGEELAVEREKSAGVVQELAEMKSVILANPKQWEKMVSPEKARGSAESDNGAVISVKPAGVTVVQFDGSAVINKGDVYYVIRSDKKVGKLVVGDVYRSIAVYRQKEGKIEEGLQVGDVLKLK